MKLSSCNDTPLYISEQDVDEVELPTKIKIVSSVNRMDRFGNKFYRYKAYNKAEEFYHSEGQMSWEDLVSSGLKEGNSYDPVQDYTVEVG